MSKFYAVRQGRNIGIYLNWPACEKQIKGYSGAQYKSFRTQEEAQVYLQIESHPITKSNICSHLNQQNIYYTDGSHSMQKGGYAIVKPYEFIEYGPVDIFPCTNNIAEFYAIDRACSQAQPESIIYTDSMYAVSSLNEYIHNWLINDWKTANSKPVKNKDLILTVFQKCQFKHIKICHIKAHSGHTYNELANDYANEGRISNTYNKLSLNY